MSPYNIGIFLLNIIALLIQVVCRYIVEDAKQTKSKSSSTKKPSKDNTKPVKSIIHTIKCPICKTIQRPTTSDIQQKDIVLCPKCLKITNFQMI